MVKYQVIGLMSGTSLDGLDIACCDFSGDNNHWTYQIRCAETVPYAGYFLAALYAKRDFRQAVAARGALFEAAGKKIQKERWRPS